MVNILQKNRSIKYFLIVLLIIIFFCTAAIIPGNTDTDWDGLLGKYSSEDGYDFYLREHNQQLQIVLKSDVLPKNEIFYFNKAFFTIYDLKKSNKDEFTTNEYGQDSLITVHFIRDSNGSGTSAQFGQKSFNRKFFDPELGRIFHIPLQKPAEELRPLATNEKPPVEEGEFIHPELVDVASLDPSIHLDIRYATTNNFMGAPFYTQAKAFLQKPAALALAKVAEAIQSSGYGITVFDAYRPWFVTWMFWQATPPDMHHFFSDPSHGSCHNRGSAVDVSLYDLNTGKEVDMGGTFDEFSERSAIDYPGGTDLTRLRRNVLAYFMIQAGFERYNDEWWHFDYKDCEKYTIQNVSFEEITGASQTNP